MDGVGVGFMVRRISAFQEKVSFEFRVEKSNERDSNDDRRDELR